MGKKKKGSMPTTPPKQEKKMVINMTEVELAKSYIVPGFRTGRHMTEKDRPRKKDWKREYGKQRKESGSEKYTDSFLVDFVYLLMIEYMQQKNSQQAVSLPPGKEIKRQTSYR